MHTETRSSAPGAVAPTGRAAERSALIGPAASLLALTLSLVAVPVGKEARAAEPRHVSQANNEQVKEMAEERRALVEELRRDGIDDERVLEAMGTVPRHRFVPERARPFAYVNRPLSIGHGQTISQPYVVALMTALLETDPGDRVLEIGTGSGYQAAVLAELGCEVYSIEVVEELAERARGQLDAAGYGDSVRVRHGNGYAGWPEEAPFDHVIVTAAPEEIPQELVDELAVGGHMVVPVGPRLGTQQLVLLEKLEDGSTRRREVIPVRFVPMVRIPDGP